MKNASPTIKIVRLYFYSRKRVPTMYVYYRAENLNERHFTTFVCRVYGPSTVEKGERRDFLVETPYIVQNNVLFLCANITIKRIVLYVSSNIYCTRYNVCEQKTVCVLRVPVLEKNNNNKIHSHDFPRDK